MEASFLFIQPTMLRGIARTLDLWGNLDSYNISRSPAEADYLALLADVSAVKRDLIYSILEVQNEIRELEKANESSKVLEKVLEADTLE